MWLLADGQVLFFAGVSFWEMDPVFFGWEIIFTHEL